MIIFEYILLINIIFLISYILIVNKLYKSLNNLSCSKQEIQPKVSVIVSLHNEEKNVDALINCLVSQEYPKKLYEIIMVNDRSVDKTQHLLEIAQNKYDNIQILNINHLQDNFAPKKYAIDTAITKASGEIMLLTDADGRPGKKWIQSMVLCFSTDTGLVLGNAPYYANSMIQKMLAMEYFSHATIAAATVGMGYPLTCVGTNMAYRKQVYLDVHGFGEYKNVHSGDDDLFLQGVRDDSNWNIRYATSEDSHVKNAPPKSVKQFIQQRMRYASKGFKYPLKVTLSLFIYYLFNVFILISVLLSIFNYCWLAGFIGIFFIKGIADYILLRKSVKTINAKIYFSLFPIVNIIHVPYVIFFGLLGNIKKYEWAGVQN
jgi:cellulose synthase/poly-beta-1,6-N-acetylglucosamine synthase-like glycosyltransferase